MHTWPPRMASVKITHKTIWRFCYDCQRRVPTRRSLNVGLKLGHVAQLLTDIGWTPRVFPAGRDRHGISPDFERISGGADNSHGFYFTIRKGSPQPAGESISNARLIQSYSGSYGGEAQGCNRSPVETKGSYPSLREMTDMTNCFLSEKVGEYCCLLVTPELAGSSPCM